MKKVAPTSVVKKRTFKKKQQRGKKPKRRLKKQPEQIKEQNLVRTETEPQRGGPTHKGTNLRVKTKS